MGDAPRKKKKLPGLPVKKDEPVTLEKLIAALPKLINLIEIFERIEHRLDTIENQIGNADSDDLESRISDLEEGNTGHTLRDEIEELSGRVATLENQPDVSEKLEALKTAIRDAFEQGAAELS